LVLDGEERKLKIMSRAEFRGAWPVINDAAQQVKAERSAYKRKP